MAWLNDFSDALADQIDYSLQTATDIFVRVSSHWYEGPDLPAVDLYHTSDNGLAPDLAGGAFGDLLGYECFNIRVRVQAADIEENQRLLYELVGVDGDLSIIAALDSDPTAGGYAQTLIWGDWGGISSFPDVNSDGSFIGEILPIKVVPAFS